MIQYGSKVGRLCQHDVINSIVAFRSASVSLQLYVTEREGQVVHIEVLSSVH